MEALNLLDGCEVIYIERDLKIATNWSLSSFIIYNYFKYEKKLEIDSIMYLRKLSFYQTSETFKLPNFKFSKIENTFENFDLLFFKIKNLIE